VFEILRRDGLGRVASWSLGNFNVKTPTIIFVTSERFKPFPEADIFLTDHRIDSKKPYFMNKGSKFGSWDDGQSDSATEYVIPADLGFPLSCNELYDDVKEMDQESEVFVIHDYSSEGLKNKINLKADLFVLGNAIELIRNPREFIQAVMKVREVIGYNKPLYAPAIGLPNQWAFLVYCGIDIVDSVQLIVNARDGYLVDVNGKLHKNNVTETDTFCYCPACTTARSVEGDMFVFDHILTHNYYTSLAEIGRIRSVIAQGTLRELVDIRASTEPWLTAGLNLVDRDVYSAHEIYLPIMRKAKLIATSSKTIGRPEVRRFRERVKERFRKPDSSRVLLLLPCSARKPYSSSKSHNLFRQVILNSKNPNIVNEVILTSPLGVVPRDLELFYPAQQYDIPVTGVWDRIEREMIETDLKHFIEKNQYDEIIVHLGGELGEIVDGLFKKLKIKFHNICNGNHPTSRPALQSLGSKFNEISDTFEKVAKKTRLQESLLNLARFQFGDLGDKLFEHGEVLIKGKYPYLKLFRDQNQLGMLIPDRGMISLTLEGAKILAENKKFRVEIDDFVPKGSVMAVGVMDADPEIRIEDEVVVIHKTEVRGVGKAAMSVPEMVESSRGVAVKVRHHI
jgi:archaeosine synthase